jgi:hypothetical protein
MISIFSRLRTAWDLRRRNRAGRRGYRPYRDKGCNSIYNMVFCDMPQVFRAALDNKPEGDWATLLAKVPLAPALNQIADDPAQETRMRLLAFNRLRELKQPVPEKQLMGVIIEVGMEEGLDMLAAFPDGRVRYINHKEKMSVYEPVPNAWMATVRRLMQASQEVVDRIGPWPHARIAPPTTGMIRMSFLSSDGLYFGQGAIAFMENDEVAKPVIHAGVALLKLIAAADAKNEDP